MARCESRSRHQRFVRAEEPGDPQRCLAYANKACAKCHAVKVGEEISPSRRAELRGRGKPSGPERPRSRWSPGLLEEKAKHLLRRIGPFSVSKGPGRTAA